MNNKLIRLTLFCLLGLFTSCSDTKPYYIQTELLYNKDYKKDDKNSNLHWLYDSAYENPNVESGKVYYYGLISQDGKNSKLEIKNENNEDMTTDDLNNGMKFTCKINQKTFLESSPAQFKVIDLKYTGVIIDLSTIQIHN